MASPNKCGYDNAVERVVIGDGAEWIWNEAGNHFLKATKIIDYWHAWNRREFCKLMAAGTVGLAALASGSGEAEEMTRPNILLLMADQFRGDCLGCDGSKVIKTPNLDRNAPRAKKPAGGCLTTAQACCTIWMLDNSILAGRVFWEAGARPALPRNCNR